LLGCAPRIELAVAESRLDFDPLATLATLDGHRVTYIVIGGFGRVIQGADETTYGVDIVPSTREENLRRLDAALRDLNARSPSDAAVTFDVSMLEEPAVEVITDHGELKLVSEPAGTRGYDDLRRAATREPLGHGLRPSVASIGDLSRMLSALGRSEDIPKVLAMRRLAELEISRGIER
jgi:hypothetical protein